MATMATDSDISIRMTPSHPGHFVRVEVIDELGLNVTKAAAILGVRRATLSALLNGRSGMSAEMALRVEKAFGVSMDMLLRMQAWYDASQMRPPCRVGGNLPILPTRLGLLAFLAPSKAKARTPEDERLPVSSASVLDASTVCPVHDVVSVEQVMSRAYSICSNRV